MATQRAPRTPKYRLHRPSGLAVVTIGGRDRYVGRYGTPESRAEYDRLIAEWLLAGRQAEHVPGGNADDLTVSELCVQYLEWATGYYVKEGEPTSEVKNIKRAIRKLRGLYGHTPARDFGPLALKALRNQWIIDGLTRSGCNRLTAVVKRIFRWATEQELVMPSVFHGLAAVSGLRKGRSAAPDNPPVGPVPVEILEATLARLSPMLRAMVEVQLHTGMRPGEVIHVRGSDLDMSGPVWTYCPRRHKTEHAGRDRVVFIGPRAQSLLRPWLRPDPDGYVFGPAQNREAIRAAGARPEPVGRPRRRRTFKDHYTPQYYFLVIRRACEKAKVDPWSPNQLRHSAGTLIRSKFGIEATRTILGHSNPSVTLIYAERDLDQARRIMGEIG
jgi:integrase